MANKSTYNLSNDNVELSFNVSEHAKTLYRLLLVCDGGAKERQLIADKLCRELCRCANLKTSVEVKVCNVPQDSSTVNGVCVKKAYGKYIAQQRMIVLFNKTAVRHQTVSIKVFADALLHYLVHSLHYLYYRMDESPHTSGFYKRIFDLKDKLKS